MRTFPGIAPCTGLVSAWCLILACSCTPGAPEHGTEIVLSVETAQTDSPGEKELLIRRTQDAVRRRLEIAGHLRPIVNASDQGKLVIRLRTLHVRNRGVPSSAGNGGVLEFRMVHPESDHLIANSIKEPGFEILHESIDLPNGTSAKGLPVKTTPERGLTGKHIVRTSVSRHPVSNEPEIAFELNAEGAKLFGQVTRVESAREQDIPLGHRHGWKAVFSSANPGPIEHGRGVITGRFTMQQALELATALKPVGARLQVIEIKNF
jgi:preprotein translocase subunit SecD